MADLRRNGAVLPVFALKLAHKRDERLYRLWSYGVVQRGSHATDVSVPLESGDVGGFRLLDEPCLDGFIAACDPEDHVHLRSRFPFNGAPVEAAGIDRVIQQLRLGGVSLFDRRNPAL